MPDSRHRFGEWLGDTMRVRGLSQAGLARELGVADAQVSRWRRGQVRPSISHLHRLAVALEVPRSTLDELVGYPPVGPMAEANEVDVATVPEQQIYRSRYGTVIDRLPRRLWPVYAEACEALADALSKVDGNQDERLADAEETSARKKRVIGFKTGNRP